MLELVLAAALSASSLTPVRDLTFPGYAAHNAVHLSYAADDRYEYLGTPDGLYRTEDLLDPWKPLERIGFEGRPVSGLAAANGMLYVQTGERDWVPYPTLFRSWDRGASFISIANDLRSCLGEDCAYLPGRRIQVDGNRVFIEAMGNVLLSGDEGTTWQQLYGRMDETTQRPLPAWCGDAAFEVVGRRIFIGGAECVDMVSGMLSHDRLGWSDDTLSRGLDVADTSSRRIHLIRSLGGQTVFIGTDHGLQRSDDGGVSLRELFDDPEIRRYYFGAPPVHHLTASTRYPNLMLAGALNSLECSNDSGESWSICNWLMTPVLALPDMPRLTAPRVALLGETRAGDPFIAVRVRDRFVIARINVGPARRRAARHGE